MGQIEGITKSAKMRKLSKASNVRKKIHILNPKKIVKM
jgi:hypothetical protein